MDELPADRFRVAALLHPAVFEAHGRRQVRAWTADCRAAGLILPDPTDDWRAYVVAADHVIGDHGSVTAYAAGIGRPILHLPPARSGVTAPGSAQRLLGDRAPRLALDTALEPQLRASAPVDTAAVTAALTSRPGAAGMLIRRAMYRLLQLPEPGRHRQPTPVPVPRPAADRTAEADL
jgi:hypothetical protein